MPDAPAERAPCCWPGCDRRASPRLPVPLCDPHIGVVTHQAALAAGQVQPISTPKIDRDKPGRIYYVAVGDYIKIGWSTRMAGRLSMYPPDSVLLASHEGTLRDEAALHDRLKRWRAAGNEWYHPTPEVLAVVDAVPNPSRGKVPVPTDNPEASRES